MSTSKSKTGGNLEPMPFIRRWGSQSDEGNGEAQVAMNYPEQQEDVVSKSAGRKEDSSKKHKHRSKSPNSKKAKKRSSRSPEKKHRKRSRSKERDGRNKKRSRSRSREHGTNKKNRDNRAHAENISAFPPPPDYIQQVQQRQQIHQQQQILQQTSLTSLPMQQLKQEYNDVGMFEAGYQQTNWPNQHQVENPEKELEQKTANDALSAALAAAAMVAQKLNKSHGISGGPASSELVNKLPQMPTRTAPFSESILAKEQVTMKRETPQEGEETDEQRRERRRKSRWSNTKAFVPGMPTILPADIDDNQRQIYLLQMDVEETTRRLRQGDFGQNLDPSERSPSPEPVYDATGKRLNTREVRKRQELEQRRHEKIQSLMKLNPNYKAPADYRPPNIKLHDKVWIPQEEHPEINFVGLLIGPRGNTLKALEAETGCKIIIRGKGSIKEGKLGARTGPLPGENEPLHAYVTATDRDAIKKGCEKIREIINAALMIPDGQNELRKLQLRELALLNGTLRPEDILSGARCSNCGSDQHKTWECMEAQNVTANIICTACGGAGHIAKDCKNPRTVLDPAMIDAEYSALMAELGAKPPAVGTVIAGAGANKPTALPLGAYVAPGSAPPVRQRFPLLTSTPIVRVNLAKSIQQSSYPSSWGNEGPNAMYGFSGLPGQDPAAAAAAWAAWQGYPTPVPPPPDGSTTEQNVGTSSSGLAMFPPPPPPPPPVPTKSEIKEEFDALLSAPPPPTG